MGARFAQTHPLQGSPPTDASPPIRVICAADPLGLLPDDVHARHDIRYSRRSSSYSSSSALRYPWETLSSDQPHIRCVAAEEPCPISRNRPERVLRAIAGHLPQRCIGSNRLDNQSNTAEKRLESPLLGAFNRHCGADASRPRARSPQGLERGQTLDRHSGVSIFVSASRIRRRPSDLRTSL
jgi:hypothetical protein